MSRLGERAPETMPADQRAVYEAIVSGPRGRMAGPFHAFLRSAGVAGPAQELGAHLRFSGTLPGALRELATLVVARYWTARYEWQAHAGFGREEGLEDAVIEAIATRVTPTFADPDQQLVFETCSELLETRTLSTTTYERALAALGEESLVELVSLVGYYSMVSLALNAFAIEPATDVDRLPD